METILEQLRKYRENYSLIARGHYIASDKLDHLNKLCGTITIVLSLGVCATIFASIAQALPFWGTMSAGIGSLAVTTLTFVQMHHRFGDRAIGHRNAAAGFADIRRRIEVMILKYKLSDGELRNSAIEELEGMLKELRDLGKLCPTIPSRDFKKAELEYKSEQGIGREKSGGMTL